MKEILPNIFAVEVPEDVINIAIIDGAVVDNWADGEWIPIFKLPPGSYTFLFCSNDVTEEQARGIVRQYGLSHWADYGHVDNPFHDTAVASFHSLLRSHNLTGNQAIIRKN